MSAYRSENPYKNNLLLLNSRNIGEYEGTSLVEHFERLAYRSAAAQLLNTPITGIQRLYGPDKDQKIIAFVNDEKTVMMGYIKYGTKKLYFYRKDGEVFDAEMTCVLDFFVDDEKQRKGIGYALFEHFLATISKQPQQCAYDRPSTKLIAFLKKHYGIDIEQQPNKFAVTEDIIAIENLTTNRSTTRMSRK